MRTRLDRWDLATAVVLLGALATVLLTYQDYGITWDEPTFAQYGEALAKDLRSGGTDADADRTVRREIVSIYGGLFELLAALATSFFGAEQPYVFRHLLNALVGLIGVCGTALLARWMAGPQAGFYASLILLLSPVYYGHMFNNSRDIPFAASHIWALYFLVRILRAFTTRDSGLGFGLAALFGVALGFALSVRIAGLLLIAYVLFFIVVGLALASWREERPTNKALIRSSAALASSFVIAFGIMLAGWPWARESPFIRPFEVLQFVSKFPYRLDILLDGTWYPPDAIPRTYLPHMLGVQTPEAILFLSLMGVALAGWLVVSFRTRDRRLVLETAAIACAALAPMAFIMLRRSILYDSFRHVLFIVPVFCVGAAAALFVGGQWLGARYGPKAGWSLQGVAAAAAIAIAIQMIQLHPNQTAYYNAFVGGLSGAHGRYEIDYWGNSTDEALTTLVARLRSTCPGRQFAVFSSTHATSVRQIAKRSGGAIRAANNLTEADFYMGINRGHMLDEHNGKPVRGLVYLDVTRDGVPLSRIRARRMPVCD
jgi:hypothetical protein